MKFLLDTNVVSEPARPIPDAGLMSWLQAQEPDDLGLSVLTAGELRLGVSQLPLGQRRRSIEAWLAQLLTEFNSRIIPIDMDVAMVWGDLVARHRQQGRKAGAIDELLAATAITHDLTLVTRNRRHFEASGCKLHCPWSA